MALKLEGKKAIVAEVSKAAIEAKFALVANYRGLNVAQMTTLRTRARAAGIYLRVVRNTLACRAVEDTPFACLKEVLVGPVAVLFVSQDAGEAARILKDFAKENNLFEVQALSFGGSVLAGSELEAISKLPTRDEALALLMCAMNGSVTKLVRTMSETYAQLVRVVAAIGETKQAA